jgi:signal transduction histidine kinase
VDDLFLLARAGAGEQAAAAAPLYLEELAEQCVRAVRTLARARGVSLAFVPDAELPVLGDARLLRGRCSTCSTTPSSTRRPAAPCA